MSYIFSCISAGMRGFMTHKGVPDFQRSARVILKDFITVSRLTLECVNFVVFQLNNVTFPSSENC